jgi:hypothetical protein
MEFISSAYNLLVNKNTTPTEKIHAKSNIFLIDNSLKINKLAFAYFLDRYKGANSNEISEIDSLKKYQWFAGSLTAEQFACSLQDFLNSSTSSNISTEIRQKIQKFALELQKSENQGYLIDLIRSQSLKLIFLILTGIPIDGKVDASPEEIREVTQETLRQLQGMNIGEKRIFLLGNLFHETRLTAEKQEKGWEICYFDSAKEEGCKVYESSGPVLETTAFWDKIYNIKISGSLSDLESHLEKELTKKPGRDIKIMKSQEKNTCHFRGLLGALKKECLSNSHLSPEECLVDWKTFKVAYGEFLLNDKELNPKIKTSALKQQENRIEKDAQRNRFLEILKQNRLEDTIGDYQQALTILLESTPIKLPEFSSLEKLTYLDEVLRNNLKSNSIRLEEVDSRLRDINHPCINHTLEMFRIFLEKEQVRIEGELEREVNAAGSSLNLFIEDVQEKVIKENMNQVNDSVLNYKPLKKEKVLDWLAVFIKDPLLLNHLHRRPFFACLLIQGVYLGEAVKVRELYDLLSIDDKKFLDKIIEYSEHNNYFSPKCIPESALLDVYENFPNHPLRPKFCKMLMANALNSSSLALICRLKNENPGLNIDSFSIYLIKPSRDQIEEFYSVVRKEDSFLQDVSAKLFEHIIVSGWFDLLEKAPLFFLDDLPKNIHISLSPVQLDWFESFLDLQNNASLANTLSEMVILNQYRYKLFDKILKNKEINIHGDVGNNYIISVIEPEEIKQISDILFKTKSKLFEYFIINNVTMHYANQSDKEMQAKFLQDCALHKKERLIDWMTDINYSGAGALSSQARLFVLESVIENKHLFDKAIIEAAIKMNFHYLRNEEVLLKLDELLAKIDISNIELDFDSVMSSNLMKKYPESTAVKKVRAYLNKLPMLT